MLDLSGSVTVVTRDERAKLIDLTVFMALAIEFDHRWNHNR
jgi:hypothetical protein